MKYNKASVQSVEFPPVISRCLDQREVKLGLYNSLSLCLSMSLDLALSLLTFSSVECHSCSRLARFHLI